ncbi:MAG: glycosyltransferase family 4 protein [bacterium]|nr:glycosyltransferase family 4 protein [bacterium]
MAASKRLLIITRSTNNPSFRQRIQPYIEPLAKRGVECEVQELKKGRGRRAQLRASRNYLGVWMHKKTLTVLDAFVLRRNAKKVIYEFDDAIVFRSGSESPDPHPLRLKRFRRTIGLADLVIVGSEVLADLGHKYGAKEVVVIPTGLDTSRYIPKVHELETEQIRMVWIGSSSTLKQLRLFTEMLDGVGWQIPEISLRVIADDELVTETLPVENVPWSREQEARLINECDIGIAPLPDTPFARGKCAFKVLQYMASGLPVVTSDIGANAEYVTDYESGFHAYDDQHWAECISQLVYDNELRASQGQAGRTRACEEFDFKVLAPKVCDAIIGVLEQDG